MMLVLLLLRLCNCNQLTLRSHIYLFRVFLIQIENNCAHKETHALMNLNVAFRGRYQNMVISRVDLQKICM